MRILKPYELEGIVTLTSKQKSARRKELFQKQRGICGCGCGRPMTMELDQMGTATLEHHSPNKMGCRKNDGPTNVFQVWRWDCNMKKGSKRL